MQSSKRPVMDFVVLNHDEDLLIMLKTRWLAKTVPTEKNDNVKVHVPDYRRGAIADDAAVEAGASIRRPGSK